MGRERLTTSLPFGLTVGRGFHRLRFPRAALCNRTHAPSWPVPPTTHPLGCGRCLFSCDALSRREPHPAREQPIGYATRRKDATRAWGRGNQEYSLSHARKQKAQQETKRENPIRAFGGRVARPGPRQQQSDRLLHLARRRWSVPVRPLPRHTLARARGK